MFKIRQNMLAISLSLGAAASWPAHAELFTSKAVVGNDRTSDVIYAEVHFASPVTGDLYIATMLNGTLYFFSDDGRIFSTDILPYQENRDFSADVTVLNLNSNGIAPGDYPLFQVVTLPGADPLDMSNWIGGPAGLSVINFAINLPTSINGDFNGDGFADDDSNHDGYHDDDLNKDGFHDDDENHDGYHDDDSNFNGIPDPQENNSAKGKTLFETNSCSSSGCHTTNPAANQNHILNGKDWHEIRDAINSNKGGMSFLNYLTDADLQAISDYLKTF